VFRNQHKGHLDQGAAAVEIALLLPLLLLVLFGLVDFGRAFNTQMQVTQAAREAVRVKALGRTDIDAQNRVTAATQGLPLSPGAPFPVPTVYYFQRCPQGDTTANATVKVGYSFQFLTPLGPIASWFGGSTIPGVGEFKTLTATGTMRCAG